MRFLQRVLLVFILFFLSSFVLSSKALAADQTFDFTSQTGNELSTPPSTTYDVQNFTLSAWLYQKDRNGAAGTDDQNVIEYGDGNIVHNWALYVGVDGNVALYSSTGGGYCVSTNYAFPMNEWHMLTAVHDATSTKIYVDTTLIQTCASNLMGFDHQAGIKVSWSNFVTQHFHGYIDELVYLGRSWTSSDITADYNNGLGTCHNTQTPNLLFGFHADGNTNDIAGGSWASSGVAYASGHVSCSTSSSTGVALLSDSFSGQSNLTVPQYNPTDYYLSSGYYTTNNANMVLTSGGIRISPSASINSGAFNTDMSQFGSPKYYCSQVRFTRSPLDNEVYPSLGLHNNNHSYGGQGISGNFDFHFDTSSVNVDVFQFETNNFLIPDQTFTFDNTVNTHTIKVCNLNGIVTNYIDGLQKQSGTYFSSISGGDPTVTFNYAPNSVINNFTVSTDVTPTPTPTPVITPTPIPTDIPTSIPTITPTPTPTITANNWTVSTQPVLQEDGPGTWDSSTVALNGSAVISQSSVYKMWFYGDDGHVAGIGYATSPDGINWTKYQDNPVISGGVGAPSVLFKDNQYKMWFANGQTGHFDYATSSDGISWTTPVAVLNPAEQAWEQNYIITPNVNFINGQYIMYYTGNTNGLTTIGFATSPDGINWTKYTNNPVLSQSGTESNGVAHPDVIFQDGIYTIYYESNFPSGTINTATSPDGINWTRSANNPIITNTSGYQQVGNPSAIENNGINQLWFDQINSNTGHQTIWYAAKAVSLTPTPTAIPTLPPTPTPTQTPTPTPNPIIFSGSLNDFTFQEAEGGSSWYLHGSLGTRIVCFSTQAQYTGSFIEFGLQASNSSSALQGTSVGIFPSGRIRGVDINLQPYFESNNSPNYPRDNSVHEYGICNTGPNQYDLFVDTYFLQTINITTTQDFSGLPVAAVIIPSGSTTAVTNFTAYSSIDPQHFKYATPTVTPNLTPTISLPPTPTVSISPTPTPTGNPSQVTCGFCPTGTMRAGLPPIYGYVNNNCTSLNAGDPNALYCSISGNTCTDPVPQYPNCTVPNICTSPTPTPPAGGTPTPTPEFGPTSTPAPTPTGLPTPILTPSPTTAPTPTPLATTGWPIFQYNSVHTGYNSSETTLTPPLSLLWSKPINSSSFFVVQGNTLYTTDYSYVYSINDSTGAINWQIPVAHAAGLAISGNTLVVGTNGNGNLTALNASNGSQIWATSVPDAIFVSIDNNTILTGGNMHAEQAHDLTTGQLLWSSGTNDGTTSVAAASNGIVYTGTYQGSFYAFNESNGNQLWTSSIPNCYNPNPTIINNLVYVTNGCGGGGIYALDPNTGNTVWQVGTVIPVPSSVTYANNVIYVQKVSGEVIAVNPSTRGIIWSNTTPQGTHPATLGYPIVVANGVVYAGSADGNIYAFDSSTGSELWHYSIGGYIQSPIATDGKLFASTTNGGIYAFSTQTLTTTPTPSVTPVATPTISPTPTVTPTPTPTPIPSNVVSLWPLNTNAQDIVGSNTGTVNGTVTFTNDYASFTGNGEIDTPANNIPTGTTPRTFAFDFNTTYNGVDESDMLSYGTAGSYQGVSMGVIGGGKVYISTWGPSIISNDSFSDGQWHHAQLQFLPDGTGKIYVDGILEASGTLDPDTVSTGASYIGRREAAPLFSYNGLIKNISITNDGALPTITPSPTVTPSVTPTLEPVQRIPTPAVLSPQVCKPGFGGGYCTAIGFDTTNDLAFQGNGFAKPAVALDVIPGYDAIHRPEYVNDGYYGNSASWINNSPNSWVKIDLGRVITFDTLQFGRDRSAVWADRNPGQFQIAVATNDDVYANGNGSNDANEYTTIYDSSLTGFSGTINLAETLRVHVTPVTARYVKMFVQNAGADIDEIEIFNSTQLSPTPTPILSPSPTPIVTPSTSLSPTVTPTPTLNSSSDGVFAASNVHYNPNTFELSFDASGLNPSASAYDSIGISNCNNSAICADSNDEFWGPSTYFTNYILFPLTDPQHFDITLNFNPYRPSAGQVYVWEKTNSRGRNYSQALNFSDIVSTPTPTVTPTPVITPTITPTPTITQFPTASANATWIPVGNLSIGRIEHSATTLTSGKVLVAAGEAQSGMQPLSSTELYDPTTQTWSLTGDLLIPRRTTFNSLVTLSNGKALLVAGGATDNTPYGSTELYDPISGTWSETGNLNTPRRDALTTLLNDGRVLVVGGTASSYCGALTTAELYDPQTGVWSYTSNNLVYDREGSSLVKLSDGRVLVAGGNSNGCSNTFWNTVEIFDPITSLWSTAAPMPYSSSAPKLTLLADGRVFSAGGINPNNMNDAAIYNPTTNTWETTASLPQVPAELSFLRDDGTVLVRTGVQVDEIYNPTANTWTTQPISFGDRSVTAILQNGDVLTMGGISCGQQSQASCIMSSSELYTLSTSLITPTPTPILTPTITPTPMVTPSPTVNPTPTFASPFVDTFTDIDGTSLTSHNSLWTLENANQCSIQNNQLTDANGANCNYYVSQDINEGKITTDFIYQNNSGFVQLFMRGANPPDGYMDQVLFRSSTDGSAHIDDYSQWPSDVTYDFPAGTFNTGDVVHLEMDDIGNTVTFLVNGIQVLSSSTSTNTHGPFGIGMNSGATIDNFVFTAVTNSITPTVIPSPTPTLTPTPTNTPTPLPTATPTPTLTPTPSPTATPTPTPLPTATPTPVNQAPVINTIPNGNINEGGLFSFGGLFSDGDSSGWTGTVDYGDGSGVGSLSISGTGFTLNHTYADNGIYSVTVTITDNQGTSSIKTFNVVVNNVAPVVSPIGTLSPVQQNISTNIVVPFSDGGIVDTHTATINWGDGITDTGVVTEANGSGTVAGSHTYATPGTYTVTVTVTDNNGASTQSTGSITITAMPTPTPLPTATPTPTNTPTPTPTHAPTPTPTNTPTPTPTPIPTTTVTFNDRTSNTALNGTYAGINWGTNIWDVDGAIPTDTTNSTSFHTNSIVDGSFSFVTPQVLVSLQIYSNSSTVAMITVSCANNPTVSVIVNPNTSTLLTTNWANTCTTVNVTSSNGWNTNIDNIIYAPVASPLITPVPTPTPIPSTIGYTRQGAILDTGDANYMNGTKFTTGSTGGTATSMSVFVGNVDTGTHNQYQMAIYSDNAGAPKTLVAKTASGTLAPVSWNTLAITATLAPNTTYWLMYNTNASTSTAYLNNMYYDTGATGIAAYAAKTFNSWPTTFPTATLDTTKFSIYVSYH